MDTPSSLQVGSSCFSTRRVSRLYFSWMTSSWPYLQEPRMMSAVTFDAPMARILPCSLSFIMASTVSSSG